MPRKGRSINWREKALIVVAVAAISVAAVAVFWSGRPIVDARSAGTGDLSTVGFVQVAPEAGIVGGEGRISLTGGCYRMVAGTDATQAQSIMDGLDGSVGPRPNTQDLMRDVFRSLKIEPVMVKITELRGNDFFGKIALRQGGTLLYLDAKPSDGIALAVRTGMPIYFNRTLLEEQGQKTC